MYDQTRAQQPPDRDQNRAERRPAAPDALLASEERDAVLDRLRKAINTFADAPHDALQEAEGAFDDAAAHLANALAERRRALHEAWQDQDPEAHDEELRLALRQYRELTQRLIRM
ncbi:hypothetical protein ABZ400_15905 [Streptomyces sp. NPDC005897]|uniref:hypothetical protein n=1 Tax=Streptomyces sp. NPDC005897 TaxID=3157081 RepID=UPI0033E6DDF7